MINYEKEHRRLWNWLADHPEAEKEDDNETDRCR